MAEVESWPARVARERKARGLSQDDLAYAAREHGAPRALNSSWVSKIRLGKRPATPAFFRGIAGALGIKPECFAEYRLARIREMFDERAIGLEEAAANLRALEELVGEEGLPGPPGELGRRLRGESPSSQDRELSRSEGQAQRAGRRNAA